MRLSTIRILALAALATASVSAYAQATFSTGGNVPVGASFFVGSGGVIDTGTDYFKTTDGLPTNIESGNVAISPTSSSFVWATGNPIPSFQYNAANAYLYDGSNPSTSRNILLQIYTRASTDFSPNGFQFRFTFPETVAGNIGFISGWELSPDGQTTTGFETAFDFTFDGLGSIYITPNGSFTPQDFGSYQLSINLTTTAIPEPATAALGMALVAGGLVAWRRRRRA